MMRITNEDLREAIEAYCVLLNRPQWLAEDRMLMQERVWRRVIENFDGSATVRVDHVIASINAHVLNDDKQWINPTLIIEGACSMAEGESQRVSQLYAAFEMGTPIMLEAISHYRASRFEPTLVEAVADARRILALSPLDGGTVEQMIAEIEAEVAAVRSEMSELEPPAESDVASAETVISEWLQ